MDQKNLLIYLAGNIQKGHEKESAIYWTQEDLNLLTQKLKPTNLTFLNPALRSDDLTDQKSVFGRDMTQVYCSDLIFVDARERRGLGVGAEMMWAKMNHIPVLILAPKDSHYRRNKVNLLGTPIENWTHPFVESLGDFLVSDMNQAAVWIQKNLIDTDGFIRDREYIHEAMRHYRKTQFSKDLPMLELANLSQSLKHRIENLPEEIQYGHTAKS